MKVLLIAITLMCANFGFAQDIDAKIERKTNLLKRKVENELHRLSWSQKDDLDAALRDALRVFVGNGGGGNGGGGQNFCRCESGNNKLWFTQIDGTEFMIRDYNSGSACLEGMSNHSICRGPRPPSCVCESGNNKLHLFQYDNSKFMIKDYNSGSSCIDGLQTKQICQGQVPRNCRCESGNNKLWLRQHDGSEFMVRDYNSGESCIAGMESNPSCF